jgi:hypothetical protein
MKTILIFVLCLTAVVGNATTIFLESGTDATQGTSFWSATAGTVTSDSAGAITGPRSIKVFTSSPAVSASVTRNAVLADAGRRVSFRFKSDTIPPAANSNIIRILNSAGTLVNYALRVNVTTGILSSTPTGVSTLNGTTALNANTPYRITLSYTVTNSTTWTFKIYLNGKLEINHSNAGTMTTIGTDRLEFGVNLNAGTNVSDWFDDIYVDNGSGLDDPGNIIVTNKRPNANGAANAWTTQIGSGGSGYGTGHSPQVNEQPLSVTNGWSIASASLLTEQYTIEGAATGDINVSNPRYVLVDYMGWVHAKVGSAGTRNIVVNGAASNVSLTTTATTFLAAAGSTTYPSGNTAIGMNNNSVNNLTSLYECGILLAYKLPRRVSVTP